MELTNDQALKKGLSVISSMEDFYKNSKNTIVNNAAQGWFFCASFDNYYIEEKSTSSVSNNAASAEENASHAAAVRSEASLSARATIDRLNDEKNIIEKFNKLKELIQLEDGNLVDDSFAKSADIELSTAQERAFDNQKLNLVIIGGGICGLFLANVMKNTLGDDVNILILDNRSEKKHTRKVFNREWVTHLPADIVQQHTPDNINELLQCFGTNGLIGLPINMMEAVLMLSCKDQGVKFYFSPTLNNLGLDNKNISLIFDATGGRLNEGEYAAKVPPQINVKLPNITKDFTYAGINQLCNFPHLEPNYVEVSLEASGQYHFPHIGSSKIHTHMIKLTGIPINLFNAVLEFIEPRNKLNLIFVWQGVLRDEFNQGLVLINLSTEEYDKLTSCIDGKMALKALLENNGELLSTLDDNIKPFIEFLVDLDDDNRIEVDPPFSYSPYINLNAEFGHLGDKRIFPVGDAYFCGHPKVGNGLWTHLGFISDLSQVIAAAYKN